MPVTAKLSRKFYERLGEDVANELVEWFNAVDATYRNDLRQLNELNFQRFDAKVEQRFAEFDTRLERRFAEMDVKWEQRLAASDAKWEQRMGRLEVTVERRLGAISSGLIKWMFAFWIGTLVPLAGLILALSTR